MPCTLLLHACSAATELTCIPQYAGFNKRTVAEMATWNLALQELVRHNFFACEERGMLLNRARQRVVSLLEASDGWCRYLGALAHDRHVRGAFARVA